MHRNQYTKVNDKKVLHKVKKQWVVISSAILMAMSSGMVVNHITQKPTSMIDTIETQASGLHNHLLQSGLRAHADTIPQSSTNGQSVNVQNASNNTKSSLNQQPSSQSAVTINTSKGPVAVSNTPYNSQIAKQQQSAANAQNTATNSNTYQSVGSIDAQASSSNVQSGSPLNQQPINNGSQSAVTIDTARGPVAVSNTPYNSQIANQQAADAQNTAVGTSLSNNSSESSNHNIHINLQSIPPKEQLSEKKPQHQPVWYIDKNGRKYDIAPGAVFDAGDIGKNNKDVKGRIIKNPYMRFEDTYKVGQLNTVNDTYPSVPYTLNGDDDLFKEKPIPKNWKLYGISDNQVSHLNLDQLQKKFNYEDPKYNFVYNANNGKISKNYMYTFSPNYIRSDGGSYIQVPNRRRLNGPNGIPSPYRLKVFNVPQQDTVKFNGLKAGTIVNNLAIGKIGNDFGNSDPGLNLNNPENISAPVGYHFVATGSSRSDACHNFSLNNYVPDIGSDGVVYYNYGQSDNYNDTVSDTNTNSNFNDHSGNNYYFKHFNIGTIDGSFITLNVAPDTEHVIYTYNGNRVDVNYSDNYTYNSDNKYNTDENGNPIADVITSSHHPGLPVGYHLVDSTTSTSVPFTNGTMEVPVEPNTFDFDYVDEQGHQIEGTSSHHYDQPNEPFISDVVNDIHNDVPRGFVLVGGQTNGLKYDNQNHDFKVVLASNLRKTVTRTIHYENANNLAPHDIAPSVSQPITYDRTATLSNNSVSYSPFSYSSGTGTWSAVATPNLSSLGYQSAESAYSQSVPSVATPNGDQASNCSIIVKYPDASVVVTPNKPGNPDSKIPDGSSTWPNGTGRDDLTKTITRMVRYFGQNGNKLLSDVIQNVTYTRSMAVDKVTGAIERMPSSESDWSAQSATAWSQVNIPDMSNQGYGSPYVSSDTNYQIPQNKYINSISSENIPNKYTSANDELIDICYPDAVTTVTSDTTKVPGTRINSNSNVTWPKGTDSDSLVHKITRTINYVNSRHQTVAPTVTQTVTYSRMVKVDDVTGQIVKGFPSAWAAKNGSDMWKSVMSPDMSKQGYGTPYTYINNQKMVNVPGKYISSNYTSANDETIDVLYPDKTTVVTPSDAKTPGTRINSDSNVVWPSGTDENSLTKTITRTIHYVNERGQKVAPDKTQAVTFNNSVIVDEVTGHKSSDASNWYTKNNTWSDVTSPDLSHQGYVKPDKTLVGRQTVSFNDSNVNVTVIYSDNESDRTSDKTVTRTIYYRDRLTNHEIAGISPVTQTVNYTHVVKRNDVTNKIISDWQTDHNTWSDVSSPDLTIKGYSAPSLNNVRAVTVNHDSSNQTVNITYNPGTIIIYPNGIDNHLSQTTTQTINYVGPDGTEIQKPNEQIIHFNRTATEDRVTGQIINYSDWQPDHGYVDVTSPNEPGLYPNQKVIKGNSPQDPAIGDTTITVQYQRAKSAPVPKPNSNAPASGSPAQSTSTVSSGSNQPRPNLPSSSSLRNPTSRSANGSNNRPNIPGSKLPWRSISGSSNADSSTSESSSSLHSVISSAIGGHNVPGFSSSRQSTSGPANENNKLNSNVPGSTMRSSFNEGNHSNSVKSNGSSLSGHSPANSIDGGNVPNPNVSNSNSSRQSTSEPANKNNKLSSNVPGSTVRPAPSSGNNYSSFNVPKSTSSWPSTSGSFNESNHSGSIESNESKPDSSQQPTSEPSSESNVPSSNAQTLGPTMRLGASQSSMNSYISNEVLSNLGFKPLRRHTPMFSKSRNRNKSYPFVKLNTRSRTVSKHEGHRLPHDKLSTKYHTVPKRGDRNSSFVEPSTINYAVPKHKNYRSPFAKLNIGNRAVPRRENRRSSFVGSDTGRYHTTPRREDRHLPQTGENHNYSGLFGAIMTLAATLIAALGRGFDRRHNK